MKELRSERNKIKQHNIQITTDMVTQHKENSQLEMFRARWSPGLLDSQGG